MIIEVDTRSPVPPYEQIRQQLASMVASGRLSVGTQLPSVRQLAKDLGLAPGTVARAYKELDRDHVIAIRGRRGAFVGGKVVEITEDRRDDLLADAAHTFAVTAHQLDAAEDDALVAVRAALRALGRAHR